MTWHPLAPFTAADMAAANPDALVAGVAEKEGWRYNRVLMAGIGKANAAGKPGEAAALDALARICLARLDHEDGDDEKFRDGLNRTLVGLDGAMLDELAKCAPALQDAELRAAVADAVWILTTTRSKHWSLAQVAAAAWFESAKRLEDQDHWPRTVVRLKRAHRLASGLKDKARLQDIEDYVLQAIDRHGGKDALYMTASLIEMATDNGWGDAKKFLSYLANLEAHADGAQDYHRLQRYLDIRVKVLAGDAVAERQARIDAATAVMKRHATLKEPGVRSADIKEAIDRLRQIPGTEVQVEQLHVQLVQEQSRMMAYMAKIGAGMDISKQRRQAEEAVRGKTAVEALLALALDFAAPTRADCEKGAAAESKSLHRQLFPSTLINRSGKTVAVQDPVSGAPTPEELATMSLQYCVSSHSYTMASYVDVARRIVHTEHNLQLSDFLELVRVTPFVPPQQRRIFAKGLVRGLEGRIDEAGLILAPLMESALRHCVEQHGVVVSSLNDEGIQKEWSIERVLDEPKAAEIFGPDVVFCLRALLTTPEAGNFRNRVGHGLLSDSEATGALAMSVWWWALRLCIMPIASHLESLGKAEQAQPPPGGQTPPGA